MPSKTAVPPALGLDWGTERALLDSGPRASPGSSASDAMQRSRLQLLCGLSGSLDKDKSQVDPGVPGNLPPWQLQVEWGI